MLSSLVYNFFIEQEISLAVKYRIEAVRRLLDLVVVVKNPVVVRVKGPTHIVSLGCLGPAVVNH